jgi:hypothetical protein
MVVSQPSFLRRPRGTHGARRRVSSRQVYITHLRSLVMTARNDDQDNQTDYLSRPSNKKRPGIHIWICPAFTINDQTHSTVAAGSRAL